MKMVVRISIALAVLLGFFGGVSWAYPNWMADVGVDVWHLSEYERELQAGQRQITELDHVSNCIGHRIAIKDELIRGLIEGRETYRDVVIQFWTLNHQSPNLMEFLAINYPANSRIESICWNVIDYTKTRTRDNPSLSGEMERKLILEMQALLQDPELSNLQ